LGPESRPAVRVEIENYLYTDESICYYQFFTDTSALNFKQNDYQWQVTFEELRNVDAVISKGEDI